MFDVPCLIHKELYAHNYMPLDGQKPVKSLSEKMGPTRQDPTRQALQTQPSTTK